MFSKSFTPDVHTSHLNMQSFESHARAFVGAWLHDPVVTNYRHSQSVDTIYGQLAFFMIRKKMFLYLIN